MEFLIIAFLFCCLVAYKATRSVQWAIAATRGIWVFALGWMTLVAWVFTTAGRGEGILEAAFIPPVAVFLVIKVMSWVLASAEYRRM